MSKTKTDALVAIKACGCAVAACLDSPATRQMSRRATNDWRSRGWTVERMSVERANRLIGECPHKDRLRTGIRGQR